MNDRGLNVFAIVCILLTIVLIHLNYQQIGECEAKGGVLLKTADGLASCIEAKKIK
jgi:hypothetical protein